MTKDTQNVLVAAALVRGFLEVWEKEYEIDPHTGTRKRKRVGPHAYALTFTVR